MSELYFWPMLSCHTQTHAPANLLGTNTSAMIAMLSSTKIHKCVNSWWLFSLCQYAVKHDVMCVCVCVCKLVLCELEFASMDSQKSEMTETLAHMTLF